MKTCSSRRGVLTLVVLRFCYIVLQFRPVRLFSIWFNVWTAGVARMLLNCLLLVSIALLPTLNIRWLYVP